MKKQKRALRLSWWHWFGQTASAWCLAFDTLLLVHYYRPEWTIVYELFFIFSLFHMLWAIARMPQKEEKSS